MLGLLGVVTPRLALLVKLWSKSGRTDSERAAVFPRSAFFAANDQYLIHEGSGLEI